MAQRPTQRPLRKIPTPQNLVNVALHYLGKYAASEASLRRVLENRIRRAAMDRPEFAADIEAQGKLHSVIETIIEGHKRTGILNDDAFAETKILSMRRQGRSRRVIQQKLAAKGVKGETVEAAFTRHEEDTEPADAELKAALALARKRKFGPFAKTPPDEDKKRKQMAAMARAGFSFDTIKAALGTSPYEEDVWQENL